MILAKHIMRHGAAVKSHTPATTIVSRLSATGLPGLCVINDESEVIGVVTEFNILGALREGMKLDSFDVERIMTKDPVTADVDTPAHELIKIMLVDNFSIIPIVHGKKLAGVISRQMILDAYTSPEYYVFMDR